MNELRNISIALLSLLLIYTTYWFWREQHLPQKIYSAQWQKLSNQLIKNVTLLHTTKYTQLMVISLPPQQKLNREAFDADQVLIGIEGHGTLTAANVHSSIAPHTVLTIPSGLEHTITNTGSTPITLYKIFAPPFLHPSEKEPSH